MAKTVAQGFFTDPRLVEAKNLFNKLYQNMLQKLIPSKLVIQN